VLCDVLGAVFILKPTPKPVRVLTQDHMITCKSTKREWQSNTVTASSSQE